MRPPLPPFPIAPTPPTADSSNRIATTQFVHLVATGGSGAASIGFASRVSAAAATIDPATPFVLTGGYAVQGDGGEAAYYRVGGDPGNNSGFQSADGQWWALIHDGEVNVKQFGAKGDGVTIDTAAINHAYNFFAGRSGRVYVPPANYQIDDTIKIGVQNGTNTTSFISTYSPGSQDGTQFRWVGGNNKLVLGYYKNKGATMENIRVVNQNGATGCTGFGLGGYGPGDFGNSSLNNTFRRCEFGADNQAWDTAVISGINFGCGSECTFINCGFVGNAGGIGFTHSDFNSLDFLYLNCGFAGAIGWDSGAAGGPFAIIGGSSSQNTVADFRINGNSARGTVIMSYRSEDLGLNNSAGSPASHILGVGGEVTVIGNELITPRKGSLATSGNFHYLSLLNCHLEGWVTASSVAELSMVGCAGLIDPYSLLPFVIPLGSGILSRVIAEGNTNVSTSTYVADFKGCMSGIVYGPPFSIVATDVARFKEPNRTEYVTNVDVPFGVTQQALCYTKQLSEGPLPLAFTPDSATFQTATTTAASAAGLNYLTINPVPGFIVPGMVVADATTGSAIPFGAAVLAVDSGNNRVVLNTNITAPGVGNGDTIRFWTPLVKQYRGRNLRIQGQFNSSGTLAIAFTRTLTANNAGADDAAQNGLMTANTGRFFPADFGKLISIAGKGTNGWTDWIGHATEYVRASGKLRVYSVTSLSGLHVGSATNMTIGENEPDANYMVDITGNANETFWVDDTTITTTGFTVKSSNAASTATVTCVIIR